MRKIKKINLLFLGILILIFLKINFHYGENPAKRRGDHLYWKDNEYITSEGYYKEGRKIARGEDFSLYSVGDLSDTFVVYRSFLDNYLYVKKDFKIPTEGEITKLSWKGEFFNNKNLCNTIQKLLENTKNLKVSIYESPNQISVLKPDFEMGQLHVAYENTYIPTEYKGYIGILNGNWAITTNIERKVHNGIGFYKVSYVIIPEEYIDILNQHFNVRKKTKKK